VIYGLDRESGTSSESAGNLIEKLGRAFRRT